MDIIYDDEVPECEDCFNDVYPNALAESLEEFKRVLCWDCMDEM